MSYKPEGASLPKRFKKSNTNTNSNYKQRPKDRLCVIDGYILPEKSILATEIDTGRKIQAKINPDKAGSAPRSSADKWNGNIIDERMESAIPVGSRFVLEGCETERNIKKPGNEISIMRCSWISSIPDQSPEKSVTGVFTVSAWEERIASVQMWNKTAVNPQTEEGEAEIIRLGEEMDKVLAAYNAKERPIPLGVQFRTLIEIEKDREGKPVYEMVDCSPPFDWITAKKDAEGNVIKQGHPLDREHLEMYLEGYLDYVYGSPDQNVPNAEPGLVAAGIIPEGKEVIVEVMPYKAYTASSLSKNMELRNEKMPLYRLAHVMTKYDQRDTTSYEGKNWAVDGIMVLTGDQAPKKRGDDFMPRNLVTRLYTNGYTGNVHTLVNAFDGSRVRVHPSLDRVRDYEEAPAPSASRPEASSSSVGVGLQAAAAPVFDDDDAGADGGYFAQALSSVPAAVEPPSFDEAEEEEAAPSAPPVAEEKPAATEKKDAGKDKGSRFRRNA